MTQINPFASVAVQALAGAQQAVEVRTTRLRRAGLSREAPARVENEMEHVVETAEAVSAVGDAPDEAPEDRTRDEQQQRATQTPRIDVAG